MMIKNILFFLMIGCVGFSQPSNNTITYNDFKKIVTQKKSRIVDVRTLKEYQSGFIGNAIHIDILQTHDFLTQINALDKSKPTYLYCKSGVRSSKAFTIMKKAGFKKLYNYKGGYKEWQKKVALPTSH